MINVVVGSESKQKNGAVREACNQLNINAVVNGFKANSGQNEQPVGFREIYEGARNRVLDVARTTQRLYIEGQYPQQNPVWIGIESGIIHDGIFTLSLDIAVIVVLLPDHREIVATSQGIELPREFVIEALKRGFRRTTIASVISEKLLCDKNDPHSFLTNGMTSRQQLLTEALVSALKQI